MRARVVGVGVTPYRGLPAPVKRADWAARQAAGFGRPAMDRLIAARWAADWGRRRVGGLAGSAAVAGGGGGGDAPSARRRDRRCRGVVEAPPAAGVAGGHSAAAAVLATPLVAAAAAVPATPPAAAAAGASLGVAAPPPPSWPPFFSRLSPRPTTAARGGGSPRRARCSGGSYGPYRAVDRGRRARRRRCRRLRWSLHRYAWRRRREEWLARPLPSTGSQTTVAAHQDCTGSDGSGNDGAWYFGRTGATLGTKSATLQCRLALGRQQS